MISSPDMSSGWGEADVTEGSCDGIRQSGQVSLDHVGPRQWLRLAGWPAAHNRSRAPVQRVRMSAHAKETGLAEKNSHRAAEKETRVSAGIKPLVFGSQEEMPLARPAASGGRHER